MCWEWRRALGVVGVDDAVKPDSRLPLSECHGEAESSRLPLLEREKRSTGLSAPSVRELSAKPTEGECPSAEAIGRTFPKSGSPLSSCRFAAIHLPHRGRQEMWFCGVCRYSGRLHRADRVVRPYNRNASSSANGGISSTRGVVYYPSAGRYIIRQRRHKKEALRLLFYAFNAPS